MTKTLSCSLRRALAALSGPLLVLGFAAGARAASAVSSNWSGYAVQATGIHYRSASARWRVPAVDCTATAPAFSAMWVGLGGDQETSPALEQTGTESDCSDTGRPSYSAWYEIVPAPSRPIVHGVRPGDLMAARVEVSGRRVTLALADLTRHWRYSHVFTAATVDTSSAEWILEAPSTCDGAGRCRTLPLADFGQASFTSVQAIGARGHIGTAAAGPWGSTAITLRAGARRFIGYAGPGAAFGEAVPSVLSAGGSAFALAYVPYQPAQAASARASSPRGAGRIYHAALGRQ